MPEPPRRGIGGHLPEWLGVENAKGVLQRLLRYAEHCGPLARVTLGPVRMVLVSDAAIAAEVLDDPRANFKGAAYILTRAVLDNVLLLNGAAWEAHRKTYRHALRGVDAAASAREVSRRYVERAAGGGFSDAAGTVRLDALVSRLVGDVVGHFIAGLELGDDFEPHRRRVQYELAGLGIDLQCQPWAYLSPMRWVRLRQSVAAARRVFRPEVERRMAAPDDGRKDILNGFLRLARDGAYPLDAQALQDGAVNFFFTAHDVLASSTTWCLYLLARHPEVQSRLRASLARLPEGPVDAGALEECEYLGRVVREGLRLFPGYALFGRTLQASMPMGSYHVDKGTMVIVSPFVTHRLARYWPHPLTFEPDRWQAAASTVIGPTARDHYLPFGSGARGCLASHLALPIMKRVVAEVVRALDVRAVPGFEPKIVYWGTAYAENGLPVTLTPARAVG
jgi:cytochrome P450